MESTINHQPSTINHQPSTLDLSEAEGINPCPEFS